MEETSRTMAERVKAAVDFIVNDPPAPTDIIRDETLYGVAGLVPPTEGATLAECDAWNLKKLGFREEWRRGVRAATGRHPATVRGVGFRLLAPRENSAYAQRQALDAALDALGGGLTIIRDTRDGDLTAEERQEKMQAEVGLRGFRQALKRAQDAAERDAKMRKIEAPPPPSIPSVGGNVTREAEEGR